MAAKLLRGANSQSLLQAYQAGAWAMLANHPEVHSSRRPPDRLHQRLFDLQQSHAQHVPRRGIRGHRPDGLLQVLRGLAFAGALGGAGWTEDEEHRWLHQPWLGTFGLVQEENGNKKIET